MSFRIRQLFVLGWALLGPATASAATGEVVYRQTQEARRLFREQSYDQALPLLESAAKANPADGLVWEALGHCYLAAGRYPDSAAAFQTCLDLGFRRLHSMYNLACLHARAGDPETALQWLTSAYRAGYIDDSHVSTDSDLDPLRNDPRFQELTGVPHPGVSDRTTRWRSDLAYLHRRLREVHYDVQAHISEEELSAGIAALVESIPRRTDLELRYDIQRLLARIGDGHTTVVLDRFRNMHGHGDAAPNGPCLAYPMDPWLFGDDLYIRATGPGLESMIGARVVRIGGRDVASALAEIDPLISHDNDWGARWIAMEYLRDPGALRALGLAAADGALEITVIAAAAAETTATDARAGETNPSDVRGREITVTVTPVSCGESMELIPAYRESDRPLPRYLRDLHQPISFDAMSDPELVWVQFNSVQDHGHETIAQVTDRLFEHLERTEAEYLVIDLRLNHGGSAHLARPLLHRLIGEDRINRTGHLFVITSRETFSAAMCFATELETHTKALFVGEPTGSRPNFVGESSIFTVPYSGVAVSCSSRFHQNGDPTDTRTCIAPDLPAPLTIDDYRDNRDPAYEAIRAFIRDDATAAR